MADLSQAEVDERVAVLKRFRQLLTLQRDRLHTYLESLDIQKTLIEHGSAEDIAANVELEEKIAGDILAIQKTIEPMQAMYEHIWQGQEPPAVVPEIKSAIECLRTEVKIRWERNKTLFQDRMTLIRNEIKELRSSPLRRRRSAYVSPAEPSMIDIKG